MLVIDIIILLNVMMFGMKNGIKTKIEKACCFLLSFSLVFSNFFYFNLSIVFAEEVEQNFVENLPEETDASVVADVPIVQEALYLPDVTPSFTTGTNDDENIVASTTEENLSLQSTSTFSGNELINEQTFTSTPTSTSTSPIPLDLFDPVIVETASSSSEISNESIATSTGEILSVSTTTETINFASTTEISTKTAELVLPEKLSSPIVIRYKNRTNEIPLEVSVVNADAESALSKEEPDYFYKDTFKNTDLKYEVTENGIKESIILKNIDHQTEFQYQINLDQFDFSQTSPNTIILYKKGDKDNPLSKLYTLSAPKMMDSNGQESTDITFTVQDNILVLTPNADWLSKASYPVIIDPTIEITVLNVHSHPVQGEYWNVDFTTVGKADLTITPADQATIDDMQFTSLFCGSENRTSQAQILTGDVIYYPNWSCDEVATVSHLDLKTGSHHLVFKFSDATEEVSIDEAFNTALIWKGTAGDGKFSTAGNWSPAKVPSAGDTVTFDNTCTNCNVTIDVATTTSTFTMAATYTGTITQATGADLTVTGTFSLLGGTFTGGVATTTFQNTFTISNNNFTAASTTAFTGVNCNIDINNNQTFYNVTFYGNANKTISASDTLTVNGLLWLRQGYVHTGTIVANGNIVQESTFGDGTATIDFGNDSVAQTWTIYGGGGPAVRFNSAADTNDSVIFNAAGGIHGLITTSDFSGTIPISNPSNFNISIGEVSNINGWNQAAGSFTQGNYNLSINGYFTLSGGTWTGSTATTTFNYANPGTFLISGGIFTAATTTVIGAGYPTINVPTSQEFYHLKFNGNGSTIISAGDTLIVLGDLTMTKGQIHTGTIDARGNIIQESTMSDADGTIDFGNDSVAQTWTIYGGGGPAVRFNSAADTNDSVIFNAAGGIHGLITTSDFSGTIPISNPSNFNISIGEVSNINGWNQAAGSFTQGNYNLSINGYFTLSGGTWTGSTATTTFNYANPGTFLISGGIFTAATTTVIGAGYPTINVPTSQEFYNLQINGNGITRISTGDTLVVMGDLSLINGQVNTGTFEAKGNVIVLSTFDSNSSPLIFSGSANQTFNLTGATGLFDGDITINKTSGYVQLLSALVVNASNQDLTITSGTLDLNGNNLTVNGTSGKLTVGSTGTLQLQGGETITANTNYPQLDAGSTVNYYGTGSYTIKNYTYGNLSITGSGTFVANATQTVGGNFNLANGSFTAPSGNFNVAGDFNNTGGTFTHNSGAVVLNGNNQSINGSMTFNNLTKNVTSAATLTFASSTTQTILGTMNLQGSAGNLLSLRSDSTGTRWNVDPQGTRTVSYLNVKDSDNINATVISAAGTNSVDSGSNINWNFDPTFTQSDYRFYKNIDLLQPSTSLGGQSTVTTIFSTSTPIRLRMNLTVGPYYLPANFQQFKLQVSTNTTTGWLDVLPREGDVWWNNSWQNRRKITFNNSASTENLADFPILVSLEATTTGNINYSKTKTAGADIRFVDSDGTALNYEIEKWDTTATSSIWVKVPQIDANSTTDYIWMYYNNPDALDNATTTGVWNSNYKGVYHLPNGSTLNTNDSTISGNNLNNISSVAAAAGKYDGGTYFNGSDKYLIAGSNYSFMDSATKFTVGLWANVDDAGDRAYFSKLPTNAYSGDVLFASSGGTLFAQVNNGADGSGSVSYSLPGSWTYLVMVYDGTQTGNANRLKIYANGIQQSLGFGGFTVPATSANMSSAYGTFGAYNHVAYSMKGYMDEFRVSDIARSASWIDAEYKTMTETYNTYSDEEIIGNGFWSLYNNTSVASGTPITATLLSTSNIQGVYTESNPTALNPFEALAGQLVEYDFALDVTNILQDISYYFRMLKSDGTVLDSYTYYPSLTFSVDTTEPTSGTLSIAKTSATSLTASVSGASDSGSGLSATPYIFYNTTNSTNSSATNSTSWLSENLTPNTSYSFDVSVTDAAGNTATSSGSAYTPANVPAALAVSADSTTQLTTSWSANNNPDGTEYLVTNETSATDSGWITNTSHVFSGLTCGTTYSFSVKVRNADNLETDKITTSQTTLACPSTTPESPGRSGGHSGSGGGGTPIPPTLPLEIHCPPPASNAFTACYYGGKNFDTLLATDVQKKLNFDWDFTPIGQMKKGENFSASWQGNFDFKNKNYTFKITTDDGIRLFIDGELILDKWFDQKATTYKLDKTLTASQHLISVEYYQNLGKAIAKLSWKESGEPVVIVPPPEIPPVIDPIEETPPAATTPPVTPTSSEATSTIPSIVEDIIDTGGAVVGIVVDAITNSVGSMSESIVVKIESTASSFSNASKITVNIVKDVVDTTIEIGKTGQEKLASIPIDPKVSVGVNTLVLAPSTLVLQYSLTSGGILVSIESLTDFWFMILGLFQGLMTSLGLRSRRRYWGTVYDSRTKQPIDPAIVELIDDASGKVLEQSVTDLSGRFGFLDQQGRYRIRVRKTHYIFPSRLVIGTSDSIFNNVYHGELIEILKSDDLLTPNIPMDQVAFDWNQQEKQKIIKFHPNLEIAIQIGLNILFWLGFVFIVFSFLLHPDFLYGLFASLYVLLIVLKKFIPNRKLWGKIVGSNINPSSLLLEISPKQIPQIVVARAMAAKGGKFFLKTSKGEYILRIKKIEGSNLSTVFESEVRVGEDGVVNDVINM